MEKKGGRLVSYACGLWQRHQRCPVGSFLQKCLEEAMSFLAMQKPCDFGNWELFLEAQPSVCSYSPSNSFVNHLIAGNNSLRPPRMVQLQTETTVDTVV